MDEEEVVKTYFKIILCAVSDGINLKHRIRLSR